MFENPGIHRLQRKENFISMLMIFIAIIYYFLLSLFFLLVPTSMTSTPTPFKPGYLYTLKVLPFKSPLPC